MSSFKSSRNIQKKECGPDRSVSDNQSSSVTLNELAVKDKNMILKIPDFLSFSFFFDHFTNSLTSKEPE